MLDGLRQTGMGEPRQTIGDELGEGGDERPHDELADRARVVDRAGERDGEADQRARLAIAAEALCSRTMSSNSRCGVSRR